MFKFLGRFFKKIGSIFSNLAAGVEKVWDKYEPELQQAIKDGSGIVELINQKVDETPDFIFKAIEYRYPAFSKAQVEAIINKVGADLNLLQSEVTPNALDTLQNIMNYLKDRTGNDWAKASGFIADTIALFLAPQGTLWNKVGIVMWWVYQRYIQKDK